MNINLQLHLVFHDVVKCTPIDVWDSSKNLTFISKLGLESSSTTQTKRYHILCRSIDIRYTYKSIRNVLFFFGLKCDHSAAN